MVGKYRRSTPIIKKNRCGKRSRVKCPIKQAVRRSWWGQPPATAGVIGRRRKWGLYGWMDLFSLACYHHYEESLYAIGYTQQKTRQESGFGGLSPYKIRIDLPQKEKIDYTFLPWISGRKKLALRKNDLPEGKAIPEKMGISLNKKKFSLEEISSNVLNRRSEVLHLSKASDSIRLWERSPLTKRLDLFILLFLALLILLARGWSRFTDLFCQFPSLHSSFLSLTDGPCIISAKTQARKWRPPNFSSSSIGS